MANPTIHTVRQHLAWSYANLACAHSAVNAGATSYSPINYMIRSRLYKGLVSGSMSIGSILDDEKIKYEYPRSCCYCGAIAALHMDHLIPRAKGGADSADNLVWSCQSCNSSKRDRDVLRWLESRQQNPSILLLRRYCKLVMGQCRDLKLLDKPLPDAINMSLPFDLSALPYRIDDLQNQVLWVAPVDTAN